MNPHAADGEAAQSAGSLESHLNRCAEVARAYGLTHREEEVLAMLASGSSVPDVERALVITKSTAKGHVRNIYAKLGVHSREDLAALVGFEPRE
jgi:DNA-binding NarL/FixJ family response regulator